MADLANPRYFFLHVMKTAGTSFAAQLRANFRADEMYPNVDAPPEIRKPQYWQLELLDQLSVIEREQIRIYHGHFPYLAAGRVDADITMTILREPVERVISHIRHCRRHFPGRHDMSLEAVYEDPWFFPLFFRNYQVKQFALTEADQPKAHNEDIVLGPERLAEAVANLGQVDVVGLTDCYDEFVDEVVARFKWVRTSEVRHEEAPGPVQVSRSLRERIEADNVMDREFYEHARELHADRRTRRAGRSGRQREA